MKAIALERPHRWLEGALALLVNTTAWTCLAFLALAVWTALAVHGRVDPLEAASMLLFLAHAYICDRLGDHPEDRAARRESFDPGAFIPRHRRAFFTACVVFAVMQAGIIVTRPRLLLVVLCVVLASVFYIVPLPLLGRRLKEVPFLKSFYAPAVMVLTICLFFRISPTDGHALLVVLSLYCHLSINIALFDLKDIEGDRRAGIRTLANHLGLPAFLAAMRAAALAGVVIFTVALPYPWNAGAAAAFGGLLLSTYLLRRRISMAVLFLFVEGLGLVQLLVSLALP